VIAASSSSSVARSAASAAWPSRMSAAGRGGFACPNSRSALVFQPRQNRRRRVCWIDHANLVEVRAMLAGLIDHIRFSRRGGNR
jgi:hypothetical protein